MTSIYTCLQDDTKKALRKGAKKAEAPEELTKKPASSSSSSKKRVSFG